MKLLLMSAVALAFAAPAAAQTASPPQAHQGHAHHQSQPTSGQPAAPADHAHHENRGGSGADHSKHANCCGDANGNGRMDCCEGAQAAQRPCCEERAASDQAQSARPAPSN